jgi:integrase
MENQGKSVAASAANGKDGVTKPKYLKLRGGTYYFMRRIPAKVVAVLDLASDQMWRSLWTSDLNEAIKAMPDKLREFDELVASAKPKREKFGGRKVPDKPREQGTTKYLLEEHIPSILNRYEFGLLDTDDELRKVMTREDRAEYREMLVEGLEVLYDEASANDFSNMAEIAEQLLSLERLIAPPGSNAYTELLKQLLQRDIEVTETLVDRLRGKVRLTPRELPAAPRDLPTMLDLVKNWSRKQNEIRTIETYASNVQEFEAINGALPVIAITKGHAEGYRDHLKQAGLWRATVKNRLGGLSTLVRHGLTKSLLSPLTNPFDNVDLDDVPERPALEDRRPYSADELNVLFQSPLYTAGPQTLGQAKESSFWAPLLGPFVGARIEEIAQLRIEDVLLINGVWALRIANLGPDQTLKTDTSYRYVPLHQEVIQCGFLSYWAETKQAGHTRLFPSQKNENKHQRWSNALGKWYSSYLTKIGLNDERLCYHSFRFTFKQRCTQSGIENEVRDALTGHWVSKSDAGRGYMKAEERQYPFPALVSAINMLRYDELDLKHLHVAEPFKGVEEGQHRTCL